MVLTFHSFLVLLRHATQDTLSLIRNKTLKFFEENPLHIGLLQQLVNFHHVFDIPLAHHFDQSTLGILQKCLSFLDYEGLEDIADDRLLDWGMAVEKLCCLLLFFYVTLGFFEVFGCWQLHHACDYFIVFLFEVLHQPRNKVALEVSGLSWILCSLSCVFLGIVLKPFVLSLNHLD